MGRKHKEKRASREGFRAEGDEREPEVRIVGGDFRGRRLRYLGDRGVRPMKHRTREAIFNLISTECTGRHAIDLFAGTGALGLEAISRGAVGATFIEKHVPTAKIIEENIRTLGVEDRSDALVTSAFLWAKRDLPSPDAGPSRDHPWVVFCCPPYAFYHDLLAKMLELIRSIQDAAPAESILIVEADEIFDFNLLREASPGKFATWDLRTYAPAVVGVWRK